MLIVDDLLLLPVKGFFGLFKEVANAVDKEFTDDGKVKEELLKIQVLFETDQISEAEYTKHETILFKRLEEIRRLKQTDDNS
jgi:hypothetical protein